MHTHSNKIPLHLFSGQLTHVIVCYFPFLDRMLYRASVSLGSEEM